MIIKKREREREREKSFDHNHRKNNKGRLLNLDHTLKSK